MAGDDLDVRSAGEQAVLDEVRIDDGWRLLEEFSHFVRDSGSEDEARSVERIALRLDVWGIPYRVHKPELLVSLPRSASLMVDGVEIAAKTPSMSTSTDPDGVEAQLVHEPTGFRASIEDIFKPYASSDANVRGKIAVCEGQPMRRQPRVAPRGRHDRGRRRDGAAARHAAVRRVGRARGQPDAAPAGLPRDDRPDRRARRRLCEATGRPGRPDLDARAAARCGG